MRKKTLLLVALLGGTVIAAEDVRQLAKLPPQAETNLREKCGLICYNSMR